MKKRLCCFFFLMWYLTGWMVGYLVGAWYFPDRTDIGNQTSRVEEATEKRMLTSVVDETLIEGRTERGTRCLWMIYVGCYMLACWSLEIRKKPLILWIGWAITGMFYGIYLRGILWRYPFWGMGYGSSVMVIPVIASVLMGIYAMWVDIAHGNAYRRRDRAKKRISDMMRYLSVCLRPAFFYGVAMFVLYILDHEIIKRVQWYLLYRHIL